MAISFNFSHKRFELKHGRGKQQNTKSIEDELNEKFVDVRDADLKIELASKLIQFVIDNNPDYWTGKSILRSIFNRGEMSDNEYHNEIEIVNGDNKWYVRYWTFQIIHEDVRPPYNKYSRYTLNQKDHAGLIKVFTEYITHFEQSEIIELFGKITEMPNEELVELIFAKIEAETKRAYNEFYARQFPMMVHVRDVQNDSLWSIVMNGGNWLYFNPENGCTIEEFIRNAAKFE